MSRNVRDADLSKLPTEELQKMFRENKHRMNPRDPGYDRVSAEGMKQVKAELKRRNATLDSKKPRVRVTKDSRGHVHIRLNAGLKATLGRGGVKAKDGIRNDLLDKIQELEEYARDLDKMGQFSQAKLVRAKLPPLQQKLVAYEAFAKGSKAKDADTSWKPEGRGFVRQSPDGKWQAKNSNGGITEKFDSREEAVAYLRQRGDIRDAKGCGCKK